MALELALDEALQMLRLVSEGKRTNLEVAEWLAQHHPQEKAEITVIAMLVGQQRAHEICG